MKVEATGHGFIYRWPGGEVHLEPGKPIELPPERAKRLLMKAGTKARLVESTVQPGNQITWTRADGTTQTGVVDAIHVDMTEARIGFVIIESSWAVVNLKFVKRVDV